MLLDTERQTRIDIRLIASVLLLAAAAALTWQTIEGLSARRRLRTELAEIGHARYGLLNADRWVEKLVPILETQIATLDLKVENQASLRPMVQKALYRLLDDVKTKMSAPAPQGGQPAPAGGFFGGGNPMIVNMIVGALRPHVPEYTEVVLAELGKPEARDAMKKYMKGVLTEALVSGAKKTFGNVDMTLYSSILRENGCVDAASCKQTLAARIQDADARITRFYLGALAAAALAFALLMVGAPVLRPSAALVLLLFCAVLLAGGIFTPMLEVEAKITSINMTFLGEPVSFSDQILYFQSKSVLEVFRALVNTGKTDMWIVGVLVLMFSVVFPLLKLLTSTVSLFTPSLLRKSRIARFFALESSKWSMADVMALAIFMSFVAFNGLIANTMVGLKETGADLVIPTDSSKILPGYFLFIGYCLASLFLSTRLARSLRAEPTSPPTTGE
jgi:Paraquat-inducible protein A